MSLEKARKWIAESSRITGFSGAGISTESGIPDFRSPNGIWANHRTVTYQEFITSTDDRIEYWRQKSQIWPEMRDAKPNPGHLAFVSLNEQGKLQGMITQNIDSLHQKSGLPDDKVIELHGTTAWVVCLTCESKISMDEACRRISDGDLEPHCQDCNGILKPATVSFGQMMPMDQMRRASELCQACDVFIAVGSSLLVQPAASFPLVAKQNGSRLILINRTPTPLDELADAVFQGEIGKILPELIHD